MVETTAKKVKFSLVSLTHHIRRYMCLPRYFTKNADTTRQCINHRMVSVYQTTWCRN